MDFFKMLFQSCFILLVPVFLFNAVFYKKLPEMYQNRKWDNIPRVLDASENILRAVVFIIPVLLKISFESAMQKTGLLLYFAGMTVYFLSWIMQTNFPDTKWSRSCAGSTAPAYTTLIWFTGISLIGQELIINYNYVWIYYFSAVVCFVSVHTLHAFIVFRKK
ncbi:MAG: hypothetical protein JW982_17035 [Spirochaetes bacterium]|nr:hypothetical protein [Spirochaetota bacterium]